MRALIQRVKWAMVETGGATVAGIDKGLLVLLGFDRMETASLPEDRRWSRFLNKIVAMRVFPDSLGRTNLSLKDVQGQILVVPQFTLYAQCQRGNRPSFTQAAPPETARLLFERFLSDIRAMCSQEVGQGEFGAEMDVSLCNWGPVTIWLDSDEL
jgi:D-tyrosyl-tRNA(Tyr) deacylase